MLTTFDDNGKIMSNILLEKKNLYVIMYMVNER